MANAKNGKISKELEDALTRYVSFDDAAVELEGKLSQVMAERSKAVETIVKLNGPGPIKLNGTLLTPVKRVSTRPKLDESGKPMKDANGDIIREPTGNESWFFKGQRSANALEVNIPKRT